MSRDSPLDSAAVAVAELVRLEASATYGLAEADRLHAEAEWRSAYFKAFRLMAPGVVFVKNDYKAERKDFFLVITYPRYHRTGAQTADPQCHAGLGGILRCLLESRRRSIQGKK